jgi:hypothetical protein
LNMLFLWYTNSRSRESRAEVFGVVRIRLEARATGRAASFSI